MRELSLNVMDITQNSITAGADLITILVDENLQEDTLLIEITDNGKGMTEEQVERVTNPFYTTRTTRPVGLGIPLFKMEAEMTGGRFSICSQKGAGTKVSALFKPSHIDMVPLGDINSTILPLVTGNPEIDFIYTRRRVRGETVLEFTLDTKEIKEVLGGEVALGSPDMILWLRDFLAENTEEVLSLTLA